MHWSVLVVGEDSLRLAELMDALRGRAKGGVTECRPSGLSSRLRRGPRAEVIIIDGDCPQIGCLFASALEAWPGVSTLAVGGGTVGQVGRAARAGACGYLRPATPLAELAAMLTDLAAGAVFAMPDLVAREYAEALWAALSEARDETGLAPRAPLSPREWDVLALLVQGLPNRQIGIRLFIAPSTAEQYAKSILHSLGLRSRLQLVPGGVSLDASAESAVSSRVRRPATSREPPLRRVVPESGA